LLPKNAPVRAEGVGHTQFLVHLTLVNCDAIFNNSIKKCLSYFPTLSNFVGVVSIFVTNILFFFYAIRKQRVNFLSDNFSEVYSTVNKKSLFSDI